MAVQKELRRIYRKLGQINLLRTDRMTMAHGLEARCVPPSSICILVAPSIYSGHPGGIYLTVRAQGAVPGHSLLGGGDVG